MNNLYWFAGLWEGEGSVSIIRNGKYYKLQVCMTHTDEEIIDLFIKEFGGTKVRSDRSHMSNHKDSFKWSLVTKQAEHFIKSIYPYIQSGKEKQIMDLAMQFQSQKLAGGREATDEYRQRQYEYYLKAKELNKRGNKNNTIFRKNFDICKNLSDYEIFQWMAGIFEGEGALYIRADQKYLRLVSEIQMIDEDIIKAFDLKFPASWSVRPADEHRRKKFRWMASGEKAIYSMQCLYPHIKTERIRRKLDVAIEFYLAQNKKDHKTMVFCRQQMLELNRKGRIS